MADSKEFGGTSNSLLRQVLAGIVVTAGLVFVLMGQYLFGPPNIHSARALVVTLECAVLVVWLLSGPRLYLLKASRLLRLFLLAWFLVGVIGIFLAPYSWSSAFIGHAEWVSHVLFTIALVDFYVTRRIQFEDVCTGLILSALVIVGFFSVRWYQMADPRHFNWVWDAQPFTNIRHFAFLMLPAYVAALFFVVKGDRVRAVLGVITAIIFLAALIWAGGRASIGAAALASLLLAGYALKASVFKFGTIALIATLIVGGGFLTAEVFAVDNPRMGLSFNHGEESLGPADQMMSGRLYIWTTVLGDATPTQWLFGQGVDNYRFLPGRADETVHPHSWLLQATSAWGVPVALVLVLAGWLVSLKLLVPPFKRKGGSAWLGSEATDYGAGAMLFSYMVLSLADGNFYHSWAVLIALPIFAFALLRALPKGIDQDISKEDDGASPFWLYGVGFLLVVAIIQVLNVSIVFGKYAPQPKDWRAAVVMAVPYNTLTVESWLSAWQQENPADMARLLHWLQANSPSAHRYLLLEAEMLSSAGFEDEARLRIEQALDRAPLEAKARIKEQMSSFN